MDNSKKILVSLLVISLILNLYVISRIGGLQQEFYQLSNNISNTYGNLPHQISSVRHSIDAMYRETQWLVSDEFLPGEETTGADNIHLLYEFTLREIEEPTDASVFYRAGGRGDWLEIPAEYLGGNTYKTEFFISGDEDYRFKIAAAGQVTELKSISPWVYRRQEAEYTGQSSSGNQNQLEMEFYFNQRPVLFDFYNVDQIRMHLYRDGKLMETIEGVDAPNHYYGDDQKIWVLTYKGKLDYDQDKLVVEIIYRDGFVVEEEIWPHERYVERRYY